MLLYVYTGIAYELLSLLDWLSLLCASADSRFAVCYITDAVSLEANPAFSSGFVAYINAVLSILTWQWTPSLAKFASSFLTRASSNIIHFFLYACQLFQAVLLPLPWLLICKLHFGCGPTLAISMRAVIDQNCSSLADLISIEQFCWGFWCW